MNKFAEFVLKNNPSRTSNAKRAYSDVIWKVNELGQKENIAQGKGYLFEFLENAKYNVGRGAKGLRYESILTGMPKERGGLGEIHAYDDIRIDGRSFQCKTHSNINEYFGDFLNPKYRKCDGFVVPSDQYKAIQAEMYLKYKNGSLSRGQYISLGSRIYKGQTSAEELLRYSDENGYLNSDIAEREAQIAVNKAFLEDCKTTVGTTTISYAISGAIKSSVGNIKKYRDGDIDGETCLKNIFKDTAKTAGKGFGIGTLANTFSYIGHSAASGNILQSGSVCLTLANGVFDLGATYREYIKGNIDAANFFEQIIAKSIVSAVALMSRVSFVSNPVLGIILTCVASSVTNELLSGRKKCVFEGDSSLFDQQLASQMESENKKLHTKLLDIISKQKNSYVEVKDCIEAIGKTHEVDYVMPTLMAISNKLNLNVDFESFDKFKSTIKNDGKITI